MTQLSLAQPDPRSRYASHSRSPKAFAAALAFNGGVFALILALPAATYIIDKQPHMDTKWVTLDPIPDPVKPEPVKHKDPNPTQKTIDSPQSEAQPYVQPNPIFSTENDVRGTTEPQTGTDRIVVPPSVPVHIPVFQGAVRDPRFADAFHPAYPPALQREGREGSVTVRVTIDEKGRVTACELVKATDKAFFEETREQALKRWRFRPATSDGVAVVSQQTLTVTFQLEA